MAKHISEKLLNLLSEYMVDEIGSKALNGVTYSFVFKPEYLEQMNIKGSYVNKKGAETDIENFRKIREEAFNCGFEANELFRIYEVANGWIYDVDMNIAKKITVEISKMVAKYNGGETPTGDLIGDKPEKKRKAEMKALAKMVKKTYEKGEREIEIALFNRNATNRIVVNGKTTSGEPVTMFYNAFSLRHTDIEVVNDKFLIPIGIKITKIVPYEILPSKTGIRCKIEIKNVKEL